MDTEPNEADKLEAERLSLLNKLKLFQTSMANATVQLQFFTFRTQAKDKLDKGKHSPTYFRQAVESWTRSTSPAVKAYLKGSLESTLGIKIKRLEAGPSVFGHYQDSFTQGLEFSRIAENKPVEIWGPLKTLKSKLDDPNPTTRKDAHPEHSDDNQENAETETVQPIPMTRTFMSCRVDLAGEGGLHFLQRVKPANYLTTKDSRSPLSLAGLRLELAWDGESYQLVQEVVNVNIDPDLLYVGGNVPGSGIFYVFRPHHFEDVLSYGQIFKDRVGDYIAKIDAKIKLFDFTNNGEVRKQIVELAQKDVELCKSIAAVTYSSVFETLSLEKVKEWVKELKIRGYDAGFTVTKEGVLISDINGLRQLTDICQRRLAIEFTDRNSVVRTRSIEPLVRKKSPGIAKQIQIIAAGNPENPEAVVPASVSEPTEAAADTRNIEQSKDGAKVSKRRAKGEKLKDSLTGPTAD